MAAITRSQTKINRSIPRAAPPILQMSLFSFAAAAVGTAVGFVAALAVALPVMQHDLTAQTQLLNTRLTSAIDSSGLANVCAPSGLSASAAPTTGIVLGESTANSGSSSSSGGSSQGGAGGGSTHNTFIKKLVGGMFASTNASITNTGPNSENKIITENTATTNIENKNDLTLTTTNEQTANSGNASVTENTTGGSATTGAATNTNSTNETISISN